MHLMVAFASDPPLKGSIMASIQEHSINGVSKTLVYSSLQEQQLSSSRKSVYCV